MVAKAKKVKLTEACIMLLVAFLETSETSKIELFLKIVSSIKQLTIFTKGIILMLDWVLNTPLSFGNNWKQKIL